MIRSRRGLSGPVRRLGDFITPFSWGLWQVEHVTFLLFGSSGKSMPISLDIFPMRICMAREGLTKWLVGFFCEIAISHPGCGRHGWQLVQSLVRSFSERSLTSLSLLSEDSFLTFLWHRLQLFLLSLPLTICLCGL